MNALTAEQILQAQDLPIECVAVPEWGGDVFVKTMTGHERDAYDAAQYKRYAAGRKPGAKAAGELSVDEILDKSKDATADLVARTLCDANGNLLFTADQVGALAAKSSLALKRVCEVAQRLNGIGAAAITAAEKNSQARPGEDSPSPSPNASA